MRVSDCCSADVHYPPSMWGMSRNYYLCAHCGMACTGLDYPEPARPKREQVHGYRRDVYRFKYYVTACCYAENSYGVAGGGYCSECGRPTRFPDTEGRQQKNLIRVEYPEPARPTREDDIPPPRSACCDAPLESGVRAHWCSADGCGRQARPDGDGYNVRGAISDDRGPCERVGRYLDGAIETASEIMRLLARRGL